MTAHLPEEYYQTYDLLYSDRHEDLAMWRTFADSAHGPILEIGCGTGRVLDYLVDADHQIVGIDVSEEAIVKARQKLRSAKVELFVADMLDFDLPRKDFDLVLIPFNTFLHCSSLDDQLACLGNARRHMKADGRLVIDVLNPPSSPMAAAAQEQLHFGGERTSKDGQVVQWYLRSKNDPIRQTMNCTQLLDSVTSDGMVRRTTIRFTFRYVYPREMELLLKTTGFALETVYGGYDFSKLTANSDKMIFVARNADRSSES